MGEAERLTMTLLHLSKTIQKIEKRSNSRTCVGQRTITLLHTMFSRKSSNYSLNSDIFTCVVTILQKKLIEVTSQLNTIQQNKKINMINEIATQDVDLKII